jgi:hypothetical protein
MKSLRVLLLAVLCIISASSFSQVVNWNQQAPSPRHMITLRAGLEHGAIVGIGYGYYVHTSMPLLLSIDFSVPLGENPFDDFKTRIGGQLNVIHAGNFHATANAYGVIRRYENDFASLFNFGSEFSLTTGYYRNHWLIAAEFGFDKAIVTHVRHGNIVRENNPSVKDGWYIPTGGNFFYGLQGGLSFKSNVLYARLGKIVAQDFKTEPYLPYYVQLGWNYKID